VCRSFSVHANNLALVHLKGEHDAEKYFVNGCAVRVTISVPAWLYRTTWPSYTERGTDSAAHASCHGKAKAIGAAAAQGGQSGGLASHQLNKVSADGGRRIIRQFVSSFKLHAATTT
jgi:hypothetical protein